MSVTKLTEEPCARCDGKGWYWRCPDAFNPFYAGGFATARAMYKVECLRCKITEAGRRALDTTEPREG